MVLRLQSALQTEYEVPGAMTVAVVNHFANSIDRNIAVDLMAALI